MVKGRVAERSAVGVLGGAGWCNRSGLGREGLWSGRGADSVSFLVCF